MEYLILACITYLWVYSEPTIMLRDNLKLNDESYIQSSKLKRFFIRLLQCTLCSGYWIGVIFLFNFKTAAVVSVLSLLLEKIIKRL